MKYYFKITLLFFFILLYNTSAFSQLHFTRDDQTVVLNSLGDTLKNPWAGGFNSVQFSEIDLNLDGIKDLFVFDRSGNRISTYINSGQPNQITYKHDPSYIQFFPQNMHDWVLLRDYNCDGKMDIFTYRQGSMSTYKNTSTTQLSFILDTLMVYSDYSPSGPPNFTNLYISSTDIPAIDDIDGDGDLDVLTFSIMGSNVEYHRNLSIEKYGTCDYLDYQLRNKCWGFFREHLSGNSVILYDTCNWNIANPEKLSEEKKHSGSTLLTLDLDANNSKELVLGDVSFNNFTMLTNGDVTPDLSASLMVAQDTLFPSNNLSTTAADINVFPAGFYLDVNNDNIKDLIAAPNCYNGCKNNNNVWLYKNDNATNNPDFNYTTDAFLQDGMIDVGEGAHPVFFDYNADGLTDIIIGNYGVYNPAVGSSLYESGLWLYKNIGTASNPTYQLITTDYLGISTMNLDILGNRPTLGLSPTFGDLDNDGDLDLLLGDYNGYVHYFTNTAGAGNPANFSLAAPEYLGIDVGNDATPLLYDLNNDLLLDLIIGKKEGTFSYYENIGTLSVPNFNLITDSLGKISTKEYYDYRGSSCPFIVNDNGTTKLFSGSQNGYIYEFSNIDSNLNGTFSKDSAYLNIREGGTSYITMADVTNDGRLDMLVSNYAGGIAFYKGDFGVEVNIEKHQSEFNIYPNPTSSMLSFDNNTIIIKEIYIIDLTGKIVKTIITNNNTINVSSLAEGIYFIKLITNETTYTKKFIKN